MVRERVSATVGEVVASGLMRSRTASVAVQYALRNVRLSASFVQAQVRRSAFTTGRPESPPCQFPAHTAGAAFFRGLADGMGHRACTAPASDDPLAGGVSAALNGCPTRIEENTRTARQSTAPRKS
jgi:hypothetical protein